MSERGEVLLLAPPDELPATSRIWGTGGFRPPVAREALDWLTLLSILGLPVAIAHPGPADLGAGGGVVRHAIVAALDPDRLSPEAVAELAARLAVTPLLLVARAAAAGSPLARLAGAHRLPGNASGRTLAWIGPGGAPLPPAGTAIVSGRLGQEPGTAVWATLDGEPVATARRHGPSVIATLAFHPSVARDASGAATVLLRRLIEQGAPAPLPILDLAGTVILRMDDPGSSESAHHRAWSSAKLGEREWSEIGEILAAAAAHLSVGYVPGWVDDGDRTRGLLVVDGREPERLPGAVHPSPLVVYRDLAGPAPGRTYDHAGEYRGLRALVRAGLASVELHGHTHLHPDRRAWAAAPDRGDSAAWYRELGPAAAAHLERLPPAEHPLALARADLERWFETAPTTLICPGDEWTDAALERALDLGVDLVSSYYLALRHGRHLAWCTHLCGPYLDLAGPAWLDPGLPVVAAFHDRDLAIHGTAWLGEMLGRWREAGARRFIGLRQLAAALPRSGGDRRPEPARTAPAAAAIVPAARRPLAVVTGFLGKLPYAGMSLFNLGYILGLEALGYDVFYVERQNHDSDLYDPDRDAMTDDPTYALDYLGRLLKSHGIGPERWSFLERSGRCHGSGWRALEAALARADFVLALCDLTWFDELALCPRRAYLDGDPMFTQVGLLAGGPGAAALAHYDVLYTYAARIGRPDCSVPAAGRRWIPTRPAVATSLWRPSPPPPQAPLTALLHWASGRDLIHAGQTYGHKDREVERLLDLPRRSPLRIELAIGGSAPRRRLEAHGFALRDPLAATRTLDDYRRFVAGSLADLGIAKHAYVASRSGWFSDRATCWLAAGRPVLHQDTGFGEWLGTSPAVLPFSGCDDAAEAIERLHRDYPLHAAAARHLAEGEFEASRVIADMLEKGGLR